MSIQVLIDTLTSEVVPKQGVPFVQLCIKLLVQHTKQRITARFLCVPEMRNRGFSLGKSSHFWGNLEKKDDNGNVLVFIFIWDAFNLHWWLQLEAKLSHWLHN